MSTQPSIKLLSSGNNAIFMCHKCIDRVVKWKQNIRRSTDSVMTGRTTGAGDTNTDRRDVRTGLDNVTLSNIMTTLNQMNDNFSKFSSENEEFKLHIANKHSVNENNNSEEVSRMAQNLTALHAKIDQHFTTFLKSESKCSSVMLQKLSELQDDIKCSYPSNHISRFMSRNDGRSGSLNTHRSKETSTTDPLNWSFSFGQPTLPNDNVELYQLLNGFEQNTWASFDYLRHKLNENTETVTAIESICKKFNSVNTQHQLASPVTDSIKFETLQTIQDKCEEIEKNLLALDATIKAMSSLTSNSSANEARSSVQSASSEHSNARRSEGTIETQPPNLLRFDQAIYVSKLSTVTTCEDVKGYISSNSSIDIADFEVHRLTKKHQDISKLNFLSFKIDTNSEIAEQLLRNEFWPRHVFAKVWENKIEQIPRLFDTQPSSYFLSRTGTTNQRP